MYPRRFGDDLEENDSRLKYKWKWSRIASGYKPKQLEKWTHFSCSECEIGNWTLSVYQHGDPDNIYYGPSVSYLNDTIVQSFDYSIKTRLEAQIKAEKMLVEWISKQYKEICL
jgi:hypothetical protein